MKEKHFHTPLFGNIADRSAIFMGSRLKENIGKGAMQHIDSFNLTYFSSIASEIAICMGIRMIKVAFVCVHNSCRSQIAEALVKHFAGASVEAYSAGTERKAQINQDAVRLIKEIYGIDMEKTQKPKLLRDIPSVDIVITMGCNVNCPYLPCRHREDWGLDDPTGKSDEEFKRIISLIEEKVKQLTMLCDTM